MKTIKEDYANIENKSLYVKPKDQVTMQPSTPLKLNFASKEFQNSQTDRWTLYHISICM